MKLRLSIELRLIIYFVIVSFLWFITVNSVTEIFEVEDFIRHMQRDLAFVFITSILLYFGLRYTLNRLRQTEALLRYEKEQQASLIEQLPLVVWSTDSKLNINLVGGSGLNFLPYDAIPYLTSKAQPFFDSPNCYQAHQSALQGQSVECEVQFADHTFEVRVTPLRTANDTIIGCIGFAVDLTDTIQTHRNLVQSEARFRSFISSVDDVIYTLDDEQRHVGVYGRWVQDAGLTPDMFIGKTARDIFGEAYAFVHEKSNERALSGEKVVYTWQMNQDSEVQYFQTRLSPIFSKGKVIGIVGIGRDITEQKRAELTLEKYRQQLEQDVEQRTHELQQEIIERTRLQKAEAKHRRIAEALRNMALVLTNISDHDTIIDSAMDNIRHVLDYDGATIMLINESRITVLHARFDHHPATVHKVNFAPQDIPYLHNMMKQQDGLFLSEDDLNHPLINSERHGWVNSGIGTPLIIQDDVCGFVILAAKEKNFFKVADLETLKFFANHVSAAIQNARLHQEGQLVAIANERQRIARDLHDAVTQTLFSASVVAETLQTIPPEKSHQVNAGLKQLTHLTRGALAEMRSLLLELRPKAIENTELDLLVRQLVDAFYSRTGVPVQTRIDTVPTIMPDVKLTMYRVLQESLNNIDKHARATQVYITVRYEEHHLTLCIEDDGRGFELDQDTQGMGMKIMHERVESINAQLEIESKPSRGTTIRLRL